MQQLSSTTPPFPLGKDPRGGALCFAQQATSNPVLHMETQVHASDGNPPKAFRPAQRERCSGGRVDGNCSTWRGRACLPWNAGGLHGNKRFQRLFHTSDIPCCNISCFIAQLHEHSAWSFTYYMTTHTAAPRFLFHGLPIFPFLAHDAC